jgi:hypothetical protein
MIPNKKAMGPKSNTDKIRFIQKIRDLNIKNILFIIFYNKLCGMI